MNGKLIAKLLMAGAGAVLTVAAGALDANKKDEPKAEEAKND